MKAKLMTLPSLGSSKAEIDTPILCVDCDVMESNMESMINTCREHGVGWRPHTKCHKSPEIAHMVLKAGALGVTCAKLGEAEVMAEHGIRDILIANLIVGPQKLARLVELRRRADPIVCVDHRDQLEAFSKSFAGTGLTLRLLLEVDIGLGRVGVAPGQPSLDLARAVAAAEGVELAGIMGYEGHLLRVPDPVQKAEQIHAALKVLTDTKEQIEDAGLACPIVSCGGTGSFAYSVQQPGITELQAGGGMFMDAFYRNDCQVTAWDYAMTVLTSIVSRPTPDRAIIDAGRKTMDANHHQPLPFGRSDIVVEGLSAEHGTLSLAPSAQNLRIGDRLEIIPGYSDMTCVLHDHIFGFRGDRLEVIWPVRGRGRLQ